MSKSWAEERLGQWLREYDAGSADDTLTQLREAVEHLADCDGKNRECGWTTEECAGSEKCDHCPPGECEDCTMYRDGRYEGTWSSQPSVYALMDELENQLTNMEESAA